MRELLDVWQIAELGGWCRDYVYVWLKRHGIDAVDGTGLGRARKNLYDGDQVRAALAAARSSA